MPIFKDIIYKFLTSLSNVCAVILFQPSYAIIFEVNFLYSANSMSLFTIHSAYVCLLIVIFRQVILTIFNNLNLLYLLTCSKLHVIIYYFLSYFFPGSYSSISLFLSSVGYLKILIPSCFCEFFKSFGIVFKMVVVDFVKYIWLITINWHHNLSSWVKYGNLNSI